MTFENLDRTLYEYTRLKIVELGYLPDITNYNTNEEYLAAKIALSKTLKYNQLIEVFGVGAPESRDEKIPNKITINRKEIFDGSFGTFGAVSFELNQGNESYTKYKNPPRCKNIEYDIRIISNSAFYDRIMHSIILNVFNDISFKPALENG